MNESINNLPEILFVDDELPGIKYFQRATESLAIVATAASVKEGKDLLDKHKNSLLVIVSDQRMPGAYGNELLEYAKQTYPDKVRILTTAYSELSDTIQAVNQGQIHRYLQKPWDVATLRMELKQALSLARLQRDHGMLLKEKLQVQQKQLIANRIVDLYVLCQAILGKDPGPVLDIVLTLAQIVGVKPLLPNWHTQNYSDWLALEAQRNGHFAHMVLSEWQALKDKPNAEKTNRLMYLSSAAPHLLENKADAISLIQPEAISTFICQNTDNRPSVDEARWLVGLLDLVQHGSGLRLQVDAGVAHLKIEPTIQAWTSERLSIWLEQFV